jgi:predicted HicB family RNase H-like nuclease
VKKSPKKSKEDEVLGVTRDGTVITEELAEQWAEEFEKNPPDLSTWKRRYVGRPSLGPKGLSPRVSFRVPPDLHKAAWARADKEGRSLSELAREAFDRYMDTDS